MIGPCGAAASLDERTSALGTLTIHGWTAVGKVARGETLDAARRNMLIRIKDLVGHDAEALEFVRHKGNAGAPPRAVGVRRETLLSLAERASRTTGGFPAFGQDPAAGARALNDALDKVIEGDQVVARRLRDFMRELHRLAVRAASGAPDHFRAG